VFSQNPRTTNNCPDATLHGRLARCADRQPERRFLYGLLLGGCRSVLAISVRPRANDTAEIEARQLCFAREPNGEMVVRRTLAAVNRGLIVAIAIRTACPRYRSVSCQGRWSDVVRAGCGRTGSEIGLPTSNRSSRKSSRRYAGPGCQPKFEMSSTSRCQSARP